MEGRCSLLFNQVMGEIYKKQLEVANNAELLKPSSQPTHSMTTIQRSMRRLSRKMNLPVCYVFACLLEISRLHSRVTKAAAVRYTSLYGSLVRQQLGSLPMGGAPLEPSCPECNYPCATNSFGAVTRDHENFDGQQTEPCSGEYSYHGLSQANRCW